MEGQRQIRPLRAVIVDDERLVRQDLRKMLAKHPEVEVAGEANNVKNAIEVINRLKPNVIFLDIQMPGGSGFELLEKLDLTQVEVSFKVIFVTAYDEYAIRAFEVNALDYLVKPVYPSRLEKAIKRLLDNEIETLGAAGVAGAAQGQKDKKDTRKLEYEDRILLRVGNGFRLIKIGAIKCITAEDYYSEVLTSDDQKVLVTIPLKAWEERLPDRHFARIHRSTLINLEYLERIERWFGDSYHIYLRNIKEPLVLSRRHAAMLKDRFEFEIE